MSNNKKAFNFRNGVQVDNDNFIVNENGLVGIGTTNPKDYLLNVYGDTRVTGLVTTNNLYAGIGTVGVLSATSADVSGILTVGQLRVGSSELVDNVIGYARTTFITDNLGVGLHTTSKLGINTTTSPGASDVEFKVHGNADVTGVLTATTFSGSLPVTDLSGTLTNAQLPTDINKPTGTFTASSFVGSLTGTATTATALSGTPSITVDDVTAADISATNTTVSGISTVTTELNVGAGGTALTSLNTGRLGIGTAVPSSELQIRKASGSLVEVVSDSGEARISIGQSVGVGKSTGVLRFGSSAQDFDIINNDTGNINMYLHAGGSGIGTGRFDWIYGQTNSELMSLTYDGKLGIGKTNPDTNLHVVGTSTVTGNAFVGGDLSVDGSISGTIIFPSLITGSNLNNNSGVSTFFGLDVDNGAEIYGNIIVSAGSSIGIGTDVPITDVDAFNKILVVGAIGVGQSLSNINNKLPNIGQVYVDGQVICDGVGIGTTSLGSQSRTLMVYGNVELYPGIEEQGGPAAQISYVKGTKVEVAFDNESKIGIGTTNSQASVDFRLAGKGISGGAASFMMPPQVTTSERVGLNTAGKEGAFIFNTDTKKFQGYTGTDWVDLH